jgi:hypothetical protein
MGIENIPSLAGGKEFSKPFAERIAHRLAMESVPAREWGTFFTSP